MEPKKYLPQDNLLEKNMYDLGIKHGNDKITHHRYDLIYPMFLSQFNDKNVRGRVGRRFRRYWIF